MIHPKKRYTIFFVNPIKSLITGVIMKQIKKGNKATQDGVILTNKEYNEYKKLLELVEMFKTYKKDYNRTYKSYYM